MAETVADTEEGTLDCLVDPDGNPHAVHIFNDLCARRRRTGRKANGEWIQAKQRGA